MVTLQTAFLTVFFLIESAATSLSKTMLKRILRLQLQKSRTVWLHLS